MNIRGATGIAAIVLGALMVLGGIGTWFLVSNTLADQNITVSDGAPFAEGELVDGPLSAYAQAEVIEQHTLEATEGQTYAELERDDPLRETAMNSSFLQTSLFTSVLAFGVSAMAVAGGILFILIGLGIRDVEQRTAAPAQRMTA
jgi:hypothetical protein